MSYIDFHTHHPSPNKDVFSIQNYDYFKSESIDVPTGSYTIGLHPWWIERAPENWIEKIIEIYTDFRCIGLGEMGLDRAIGVDFKKQQEIFDIQLKLAEKLKSPFIVIHCVRAYNDIISTLNKNSYMGHIIFHDFAGNMEELEALTKFSCFFSMGPRLIENFKYQNLLERIPLTKLLLETDDRPSIGIEEVYQKAARTKSVPIEQVQKQIERNFKLICQV